MAFGEKMGLLFLSFGNFVKKNGPTIGLVGGIGGILGGTVLACWATLKSEKVVKETNGRINDNKKAMELSENADE